ncbi:MAG: hypothetical protein Q9190_004822 [Brigantiaea leucoxantha]
MDPPPKPSSTSSLFQVYLRLRPPPSPLVQLTPQSLYPSLPPPERYLSVEPPSPSVDQDSPTHITIYPPSDSRKRAIEKFAFTNVFEEEAAQLDIFKGTGIVPLLKGVLGGSRDGLLATLGVTGSGKSHTILGSKTQRGLTQLSLDLIYRSLGDRALSSTSSPFLIPSLSAADPSEAQILSAASFLDGVYGENPSERNISRAQTPMTVGKNSSSSLQAPVATGIKSQWSILGLGSEFSSRERANGALEVPEALPMSEPYLFQAQDMPSRLPFWNIPRITRKQAKTHFCDLLQESNWVPSTPKRYIPHRPSTLPQFPDISDLSVPADPDADYVLVVSMYEVYNDRIFDLLSHPRNLKDLRRRALLFKPTESSPDRKVVAGLRKVACGRYEEALMVLETGLMERRVAGTGSNSVSSRSHGFFCIEVKKRSRGGPSSAWKGAQMTIVDLAGSERARNAKTAGATLAEAGKINESLMYLGQCLQMQTDCQDSIKPTLVPFRQCKLTELLFSNSFPSPLNHSSLHHPRHRNPQKAVMIVTADPLGDFNATSQILRYSALAREVTVPRIPSVSSTILARTASYSGSQKPNASEQASPVATHTDEAVVEMAFSEIARLSEEVEILVVKLAEQEGRRREAEEGWQKAEQKAEDIEREVRDECWGEMERKMSEERRRWMGAWDEEAERNDQHLDRKLEILSNGIQIHEDPIEPLERIQELETENTTLRHRLETLEQQIQSRSSPISKALSSFSPPPLFTTPTRHNPPSPLSARRSTNNNNNDEELESDSELHTTMFKLNTMNLSPKPKPKHNSKAGPTPGTGRKMRKLTARKWDLMDENELEVEGYE